MSGSGLRALLFDLDGTLVDSAPDLVEATNRLLRELGRPPALLADLRPHAGAGARGMLACTLGLVRGDPDYEGLKHRLHDHYAAVAEAQPLSRCFDGVTGLLVRVRRAGFRVGIVTNKLRRLAAPQVRNLGLMPPAEVLVAGDCTPHSKPHPAPLLEACRRLGAEANRCIYVGDDLRDMQAAAAAGMPGWAAAWGYLGVGQPIAAWGATQVLNQPGELLDRLDLAP